MEEGREGRRAEERRDWLEEESEQKREERRLEKMEVEEVGKKEEEVERKEVGSGEQCQGGSGGMKDKEGRWKKEEGEEEVERKRKE